MDEIQKYKLDPKKLTPEQRDKLEAYQNSRNQLRALKDIADMVQELVNVNDSTKSNTDQLKEIGALLVDAREQLQQLNSKEAPEMPDHSKPVVEALAKLEGAVKALQVSPQIQVDAPAVSVTAPEIDLAPIKEILKNELPKAFDKAIKSIPKVEIPQTDFTQLVSVWEGISEQLVSLENATRMKPIPGTMTVTNPDGSLIDPFIPVKDFDYLGITNSDTDEDTLVYKLGGSNGTTKMTLVIGYATGAEKVSDSLASLEFS